MASHRLSSLGITSDADVGYGGSQGSDQTTALQAALDGIGPDASIIWDVACSATHFDLDDGQAIICESPNFGCFQRANSNRPLIRLAGMTNGGTPTDDGTSANAASERWYGAVSGTSPTRVIDRSKMNNGGIKIIGGTWNANGPNQNSATAFNAAYGFITVFSFYGIEDLVLQGCRFLRPRASVAAHIINWYNVLIQDCDFDCSVLLGHGTQEAAIGGFQMQGPGKYLTVRNCRTHCDDDHVAINADDSNAAAINGAYAGGNSWCEPGVNWTRCGPISNVLIDGLSLIPGYENVESNTNVIRLFSSASRIDEVTIRNLKGIPGGFGCIMESYTNMQLPGYGNLGRILFEDVMLEGAAARTFSIASSFDQITIRNRIRNANHGNTLPDVHIWSNLGRVHGKQFNYEIDSYDTNSSNYAVPLIKCECSVESMNLRVNASRNGDMVDAPVLLTAAGACIDRVNLEGNIRKSTYAIKHMAGSIRSVNMAGSFQEGTSPLYVDTGLVVKDAFYKGLAFDRTHLSFKTGSGTVTNDDAYVGGVVMEDNGDGTNGVTLVGRTPNVTTPGNNWAAGEGAGSRTTQGNKMQFVSTSGSDHESVVVDCGLADGVLTVVGDLVSSDTNILAIFRWVDSSNYYFLYAGQASSGSCGIYKVVSGSASFLDGQTGLSGSTAKIVVTLSANTINACINDGQANIFVSDSFNNTATKHGCGGSSSTTQNITVSNVKFER